MNTISESLYPLTDSSRRRAAEGNCVVMRRGGEQPKAELWSQTKVNPIRLNIVASLLGTGEASCVSGNIIEQSNSNIVQMVAVLGGWDENVAKCSYGSIESCSARILRKRNRTAVRTVIVVMKRSNSRGAKGGRKGDRPSS